MNYHRHVSATRVFQRTDGAIWQALWFWAKRRHRKKSARWIACRYWHAIGNRNWTFATPSEGEHLLVITDWVRLLYATDTKMRRHLKIQAKANPFDPEWNGYFEARMGLKRYRRTTRHSGKTVMNTGPELPGLY